jgi:hypothetical protein
MDFFPFYNHRKFTTSVPSYAFVQNCWLRRAADIWLALSVHDDVFVTVRGFPAYCYRACIWVATRQEPYYNSLILMGNIPKM